MPFIPSVDRPFGIYLWDVMDQSIAWITDGKIIPSQFEFIEGQTRFSTFPPVGMAIFVYYAVIFGGDFLFKSFKVKPLKLNGLFQLHNFFLTALSLSILVLMIEQLIPTIYHHGLFYAICNEKNWTQEMVFLYYCNYITKFIEFIDTIFLVVKQKKLTFLHTYHHGATALLCYFQLVGETPISWVPITLNLGVHVVMYWYYFLAARGIRVWWKQWVTRFQIIQFVIDLAFVYFASGIKIMYVHFPEYCDMTKFCDDCAGTMTAAYSGVAILSSYLVLFIMFYIENYLKKAKRAKAKKE
ncbi:Fatty acyl-CoA elongase/Polyunsaturated fatty acid specific elongation enzyme [Scheffersomyces spartinae]|uniref:Elongation of fatty acids protein n=1 Tax=Scheffersomyces spartinae TaxID=45513 RepID=A0A9P7VA53_9ASCO|nr:Fatty acyl-CoA elongase/Polyunsaturated fatty acid specific elongation enzyme [Scheffersomyces spartinae]KAG7194043.1 Fatty acyl-CoA elongase/Polyunsaturated fatty acid specific elongation enzyme [Scheffersomyces spartinae]